MTINQNFKFSVMVSSGAYVNKELAGAMCASRNDKAAKAVRVKYGLPAGVNMTFERKELTPAELLEKMTTGHSLCNVFSSINKKRTVSMSRKKDVNFLYGHVICVDIDYTTCRCVSEFIGKLNSMPPTIYYTTYSNMRFDETERRPMPRLRLMYVFDEPMVTPFMIRYCATRVNNCIEDAIKEKIKDYCNVKCSQYFNGVNRDAPGIQFECGCSGRVYSLMDFGINRVDFFHYVLAGCNYSKPALGQIRSMNIMLNNYGARHGLAYLWNGRRFIEVQAGSPPDVANRAEIDNWSSQWMICKSARAFSFDTLEYVNPDGLLADLNSGKQWWEIAEEEAARLERERQLMRSRLMSGFPRTFPKDRFEQPAVLSTQFGYGDTAVRQEPTVPEEWAAEFKNAPASACRRAFANYIRSQKEIMKAAHADSTDIMSTDIMQPADTSCEQPDGRPTTRTAGKTALKRELPKYAQMMKEKQDGISRNRRRSDVSAPAVPADPSELLKTKKSRPAGNTVPADPAGISKKFGFKKTQTGASVPVSYAEISLLKNQEIENSEIDSAVTVEADSVVPTETAIISKNSDFKKSDIKISETKNSNSDSVVLKNHAEISKNESNKDTEKSAFNLARANTPTLYYQRAKSERSDAEESAFNLARATTPTLYYQRAKSERSELFNVNPCFKKGINVYFLLDEWDKYGISDIDAFKNRPEWIRAINDVEHVYRNVGDEWIDGRYQFVDGGYCKLFCQRDRIGVDQGRKRILKERARLRKYLKNDITMPELVVGMIIDIISFCDIDESLGSAFIIDVVNDVMDMPVMSIYSKYKKSIEYLTSEPKNGVVYRNHAARTRETAFMIIDSMYDISKDVKENVEIINNEMGYKVSERQLYNYAKANDIKTNPRKLTDDELKELLDIGLSVNGNIKMLKEKGYKTDRNRVTKFLKSKRDDTVSEPLEAYGSSADARVAATADTMPPIEEIFELPLGVAMELYGLRITTGGVYIGDDLVLEFEFDDGSSADGYYGTGHYRDDVPAVPRR